MENLKLNTLPVPTFRWLGVNFADKAVQHIDAPSTEIDFSDGETVRIDVKDSTHINADVPDNSTGTLILYCDADNEIRLSGSINAGAYSDVKIVQIFNGAASTVGGLRIKAADGASVRLVQLFIGGGQNISETDVTLSGYKSKLVTDIGYLLSDNDKLDINLIARHAGKKTQSEINVKGVMNDESEKTFKGTIDFLCGSSGAKGAEKEDVMLLGDKVQNKTVPLILCAEEDVEGEHGASVGRIDDELMFYMLSRGLDEQTAIDLLARSKISSVISKIDDEQTVKRLDSELLWGESNE